jgi:hypothetical protein
MEKIYKVLQRTKCVRSILTDSGELERSKVRNVSRFWLESQKKREMVYMKKKILK